MSDEPVASVPHNDPSFEQRWDAWIARGVERDRTSRSRTLVAAVAIAAGAVAAAGVLLFQ